jgi:hypothetical protein
MCSAVGKLTVVFVAMSKTFPVLVSRARAGRYFVLLKLLVAARWNVLWLSGATSWCIGVDACSIIYIFNALSDVSQVDWD